MAKKTKIDKLITEKQKEIEVRLEDIKVYERYILDAKGEIKRFEREIEKLKRRKKN